MGICFWVRYSTCFNSSHVNHSSMKTPHTKQLNKPNWHFIGRCCSICVWILHLYNKASLSLQVYFARKWTRSRVMSSEIERMKSVLFRSVLPWKWCHCFIHWLCVLYSLFVFNREQIPMHMCCCLDP